MEKKLYDLMDWAEIEAIVYSEHDHPETVLGPHKVRNGILVQAFLPDAKTVFVRNQKDGKLYQMEEADEAGFFAVLLPGRKIQPYDLLAKYGDGSECVFKDPYQYPSLIPEKELSLFGVGKNYEIYNYLGAHPVTVSGNGETAEVMPQQKQSGKKGNTGVKGTHFAVWAPNAMRVSVVGNFNQWDGRRNPMCRLGDSGVFSLFIPEIGCGEIYKYEIKLNAQTVVLKTDPYGFRSEVRPLNASIVTDMSRFVWKDEQWLAKRAKQDFEKEAMSVYEVHLGSWRRASDAGAEYAGFMNYREIAPELAKYVKQMGYTHVELMPVMEHPLDESWGYQVTGYYAVTSRYGTPQDFMYFIDYMHQEGIGVILDWVPAHFPKDENGLARFDGTCLYEHLDPRQGEHPHWGTLIYNYARPQVANFLIANALFWKDVYHADGIRMDAVASMLYLDYGRGFGEWIPNENGGHENLQAVEFLQKLSIAFHGKKDGALLIAEESTAWKGVTAEVREEGLGFDLKWNMGWMNDFISYMKLDPYFRKGSHGSLTFSMVYAYSERYLLAFSHDEVVHGKCSMLMKMPGDMEQKFGNLRAAYGFMMTHPGKKLQFMGQEFGQASEWNEKESLHWEELEDRDHKALQDYVKDLNQFYQKHPALYENDYHESGFEWLSSQDADHSIISFMRRDSEEKEQLLVVCNFTPVMYENFKIGVPFEGKYKEIFNSDKEQYGGTGCQNRRQLTAKEVEWDGRQYSITLDMPSFGVCIFQAIPR
ncbi:MAG: 1,4-alpha-glucan branching protein GlgB [Lachnospiraceae bacterium]|jgi:1,4-alpha-glucan branching enzyme|nr:1,4-alpha-glucan branching protein GlgB [Lachnospiraceae bacterium]